jgi:hypothetical protein
MANEVIPSREYKFSVRAPNETIPNKGGGWRRIPAGCRSIRTKGRVARTLCYAVARPRDLRAGLALGSL